MFIATKKDWVLFQQKLPDWQERFMGRLCQEYVTLLTSEMENSEKFHSLEKQIRKDKKLPGVTFTISKGEMEYNLLELLQGQVITMEDLAEFSEGLKKWLQQLV
ncbi:MAG: multidrug transporter [Lachnospiraceae bacterium]|nr:multidrug transporter [Lachnospiraceae bacterium]